MKKIVKKWVSLSSFKFRIWNLFRISDFGFRIFSRRAFSLVEMLFYVAILGIALVAIMQTLLVVTRGYGNLKTAENIEQEAGFVLERMAREIRDANDIDDAGSVLGTHPGKLLLHSTDTAGAARTVEFSVSAGKILLKENGVAVGELTSGEATTLNLVFRKITTARSKGVKIELTVGSGTGLDARSEHFYATAVLRDSY